MHRGVCGAQAQHRARAQRRASRCRRGDTQHSATGGLPPSPPSLPRRVPPSLQWSPQAAPPPVLSSVDRPQLPTAPLFPGFPHLLPMYPCCLSDPLLSSRSSAEPPRNDGGRTSTPPGGSTASTVGPLTTGGKCHSRPRGYMQLLNRPHSSASLGAGHPSGMLCRGRAPPVPSSLPWETLPASHHLTSLTPLTSPSSALWTQAQLPSGSPLPLNWESWQPGP